MRMKSLEIERLDKYSARRHNAEGGDYIGKIKVSGQDYETTVIIKPEDLKPILTAACGVIVKALKTTAEQQEEELMEAISETLGIEYLEQPQD